MNVADQFAEQVKNNIDGLGKDNDMQDLSRIWLRDSLKHLYSYNFNWLSRPIIQYPQDMVAMQELIWQIKPDLIIETGIAHGGSLLPPSVTRPRANRGHFRRCAECLLHDSATLFASFRLQ